MNLIAADLSALATGEGRRVGTAGHDAARDYLLDRLGSLGARPFEGAAELCHTYTAAGQRFDNLIGVVPGTGRAAPPIVLGAHYDSVLDGPCANDNAAAVAVALRVAEHFAAAPLRRDLVVALFDAEEPPYFLGAEMGSNRFVSEVLRGSQVHLAVILDLIGHPVSVPGMPIDPLLLFVVGAETNPALPGALKQLDLPVVPTRWERVGDFSDYSAFREAGSPFLFFSGGEWPDYHTHGDTTDLVDLDKLQRLATSLITVLQRADQAEIGAVIDHDTTEWELDALRDQFGEDALAAVAARLGLPEIATRAHLDVVVPALRFAARGGH